MKFDYIEIVTDKPVKKFLLRFCLCQTSIQSLILVSPIVGTLQGTQVTLDLVCRKAQENNILTYVITRPPDDRFHKEAVSTFLSCDQAEVRFNESLHAKLYVCLCQDESQSFALLGSANLSRTSIERNIEVAMMIYGRGQGRDILQELSQWGVQRLRTLSSTKLVKKMKRQRR